MAGDGGVHLAMHEREVSHFRADNCWRQDPIDRLGHLSGPKTVALRRNADLSPTLLTTPAAHANKKTCL